MRIALFGGSFDPIHEGHLRGALHVLKRGVVQEIWFIPTQQSPLKNQSIASFEDRVALIKAMIKPYRKLKVCTIEKTLEIPSITIHTVKALKKKYPHHEFSWLMGEDQFEQFEKWVKYEELKTLIDFIGLTRTHSKSYDWAKHWIVFKHPASSSAIKEKHELTYLPKRVLKTMIVRGCYLDIILTPWMSKKRFDHTLRVNKTGHALALSHQLDLEKTHIATLLHDVAKGMSESEMDYWISRSRYSNVFIEDYAKHGFVSTMIAKHHYGIYDKKIHQAITHHTTGISSAALSRCVYVADKIEPKRPDWCVQLTPLAHQNLKETQQRLMKGFNND
jgi:nicotinate-nucleotide adenylyltransferase